MTPFICSYRNKNDYLGHAINHTCHPDFQNCKFLHTGVTKDPRGVGQEDDEGCVGGSRTSVVFVQATRRVERKTFRQLWGFLPVSSWVPVSFVCDAGVMMRRHVARLE